MLQRQSLFSAPYFGGTDKLLVRNVAFEFKGEVRCGLDFRR
jgi:hypothetical protein